MKRFKRAFARFMLKLLGWELIETGPSDPKYICIVAPHTSIIDVFYGKMYNWAVCMTPKIMIKKEFFFFPMNFILKSIGGVPIDRKKGKNVIDQMIKYFNENKEFALAITPEGTRKKNPNWKTGFYRIATAVNVPLYLSYTDFKTKKLGFSLKKFDFTGDLKADMKTIKRFYKDMEGFHKDNFTVGDIS